MKSTQFRSYYKIKYASKEYPWPCRLDQERTITVTRNDILSKTVDGGIIKHSQPGCFGIMIPDNDLIELDEAITTDAAIA
ncbi:MAG: hypothetical protein K8R90_11275 [Candidatus Cloacimonetes bacterium]|nr:hypothetical protein [Candidatus Cloacimonadota bacterium]